VTIDKLDHYTVRTADPVATSRFFVDVLGFEDGDRPPFPFPGVWLYCGGVPTVHLISIDSGQKHGSGTIDHVAFAATNVERYRARFNELGLEFEERRVPVLDRHQLFVKDPNGITIELNFPLID